MAMARSASICTACTPNRTFPSDERLHAHTKEYHTDSFMVTFTNREGLPETSTVQKVDNVYSCPLCDTHMNTKSAARKHLQRGSCKTPNTNRVASVYDEDESEETKT